MVGRERGREVDKRGGVEVEGQLEGEEVWK